MAPLSRAWPWVVALVCLLELGLKVYGIRELWLDPRVLNRERVWQVVGITYLLVTVLWAIGLGVQ